MKKSGCFMGVLYVTILAALVVIAIAAYSLGWVR